jgi:hypothetical protein
MILQRHGTRDEVPEAGTDMRGLRLVTGLLLVVVGLTTRPALVAQSDTTGSLSGQVLDTTGGAIRGADVTVVQSDTGFRRTVQSDAAGRFSFPHLRPGVYRIEAVAPAFERRQQVITVPLRAAVLGADPRPWGDLPERQSAAQRNVVELSQRRIRSGGSVQSIDFSAQVARRRSSGRPEAFEGGRATFAWSACRPRAW